MFDQFHSIIHDREHHTHQPRSMCSYEPWCLTWLCGFHGSQAARRLQIQTRRVTLEVLPRDMTISTLFTMCV